MDNIVKSGFQSDILGIFCSEDPPLAFPVSAR